jgi:nitrate reductase gamma subunit
MVALFCSSSLRWPVFPFTRLVHIWSAPVGYLFRAYQIVRAKRTA